MFKHTQGSSAQALLNKGASSEAPQQATGVLPTLPADLLLSELRYQKILKHFRELVSLPDEDYEHFYTHIIYVFAEFVQQLPETARTFYSHTSGLLDHGLERAEHALELCCQFFQNGDATHVFSAEEHRWCYAVFTASLLFDVGKIPTRLQVMLCDRTGSVQEQWSPYRGNLLALGSYYSFAFLEDHHDELEQPLGPILARQLLTQASSEPNSPYLDGFDWIAGDLNVLEAWFLMFDASQTSGGGVINAVSLAQAYTITQFFTEHRAKSQLTFERHRDAARQEHIKTQESTEATARQASENAREGLFMEHPGSGGLGSAAHAAAGSTSTTTGQSAFPQGEAFWRWLQQGVQAGTISINDANSPLHRVKEGIMVLPLAFQNYAQESSQSISWQAVQEQFQHLLDAKSEKFTDVKTNQPITSLLVSNAYLIFSVRDSLSPETANFVKSTLHPVTEPRAQANYSASQISPKPLS